MVGNLKDETTGVSIEEFIVLNPNMYSYLVDDTSEHKKLKDVNKNDVPTIIYNEYKDAFLNKKCLRYLMNRIHSKDHKIGTYEIKKT